MEKLKFREAKEIEPNDGELCLLIFNNPKQNPIVGIYIESNSIFVIEDVDYDVIIEDVKYWISVNELEVLKPEFQKEVEDKPENVSNVNPSILWQSIFNVINQIPTPDFKDGEDGMDFFSAFTEIEELFRKHYSKISNANSLKIKELQHFKDSHVGLYATDKSPEELMELLIEYFPLGDNDVDLGIANIKHHIENLMFIIEGDEVNFTNTREETLKEVPQEEAKPFVFSDPLKYELIKYEKSQNTKGRIRGKVVDINSEKELLDYVFSKPNYVFDIQRITDSGMYEKIRIGTFEN